MRCLLLTLVVMCGNYVTGWAGPNNFDVVWGSFVQTGNPTDTTASEAPFSLYNLSSWTKTEINVNGFSNSLGVANTITGTLTITFRGNFNVSLIAHCIVNSFGGDSTSSVTVKKNGSVLQSFTLSAPPTGSIADPVSFSVVRGDVISIDLFSSSEFSAPSGTSSSEGQLTSISVTP